MSLHAYDLSAGVFIRALTNLKEQLTKAEDHAVAHGTGEAPLLEATLGVDGPSVGIGGDVSRDLHRYTLAAHVHWAAEGARLAIARLVGTPRVPAGNDANSFADLHRQLDSTIAYLRKITPAELEAGLGRSIIIEHPRGSVRAGGERFLLAYAIPHFFYHVATIYGILRNQGVRLTMSDFLGDWGAT